MTEESAPLCSDTLTPSETQRGRDIETHSDTVSAARKMSIVDDGTDEDM